MAEPLRGYIDDLSRRPGQMLVARLSGEGEGACRIVRLRKDGASSCKSEPVDADDATIRLSPQALPSGSAFAFALPASLLGIDDWRLRFWIEPTLLRPDGHQLLTLRAGGVDLVLRLGPEGLNWVERSEARVSGSAPLPVGSWTMVSVYVLRASGRVRAACGGGPVAEQAVQLPQFGDCEIFIGRGPAISAAGLLGVNARIEGPRVELAAPGSKGDGRLVCAFDFGRDHRSTRVTASEGVPVAGWFLQHPTRGVAGRCRPERAMLENPGGAPDLSAVHLHEHDLTDAGWAPSAELPVPAATESGIYAVEVRSGEHTLRLPFVVRASPGLERRVLLLLPTNTYLAYANERLAFSDRGAALTSETEPPLLSDLDHALAAEPRLGSSLYDSHADGSGVHYSSHRRPILNFSPDYQRWWCTRAPRHFLADLNIAQWLDHFGQPFDVATDEDLHREGDSLLVPYEVLITGTHPEYTSAAMLRALHRFGERKAILYLGANGFYWVTGFDPGDHAVIESRRGFAGTRNWNSHPLELALSTTGEPGGLWRHRGLSPNLLVGLGFSAVGFTQGSGYRRTSASYDSRFDWLFEGVTEDVIGDFGDIMGGAAGDELDAADAGLGTPKEAVVLARSAHDRTFLPAIEQEIEFQHERGGDRNPRVCAELVLIERPSGGRVFGTGSINWCGSLAHNGFDNPVSRVTLNALRRFLGSS